MTPAARSGGRSAALLVGARGVRLPDARRRSCPAAVRVERQDQPSRRALALLACTSPASCRGARWWKIFVFLLLLGIAHRIRAVLHARGPRRRSARRASRTLGALLGLLRRCAGARALAGSRRLAVRAASDAMSPRGAGIRQASRISCATSPPDDALRPLADRMRPRTLDEFVGQEQVLGAGQAAAPGARTRPAAFADPLGPAGHRQDHAGAPHRAARRRGVHAALGRHGRRQGHPRSRRASAAPRAPSAAAAPCCSSTRCTASTRRSRTRSCRTSRTARSPSSARPPRIPSFEVISALLSRARVYVLRSLDVDDIVKLLRRALEDPERGLGKRRSRHRRRSAGRAGARRRRRCAARARHARGGRGSRARSRTGARSITHRAGARSRHRRPPPVRQGRRAVLRPDLGAAQGGARHRSGRARCTGSRACSTAAAILTTSRGASCAWRSKTSASPIRAASRSRSMPGQTFERLGSPEGELAHRECAGVSRGRAEEQRGVRGVRRSQGRRRAVRHARRAAALPQCADQAHEGPGLRRGISIRARCARMRS